MEAVGGHKKGFKLLRSNSKAVAHKTRKGFSLIEAAIVLAVVGGVIGGIWYSAAYMYENYKVNKTVSDLALIVRNVQGLISVRDAEAIGDVVQITATLILADVFPKDWTNTGVVRSPFGGVVSSYNYTTGLYPGYFSVRFFSLTKSICVKMVVKVSSMAANIDGIFVNRPSLSSIQVNYPTFEYITFPVDMATAETACTSDKNNSIYFYYAYTRTN